MWKRRIMNIKSLIKNLIHFLFSSGEGLARRKIYFPECFLKRQHMCLAYNSFEICIARMITFWRGLIRGLKVLCWKMVFLLASVL